MRLSSTLSSPPSISLSLVFLSIYNTYALSPDHSFPPLPFLYLLSFCSSLFVFFLSLKDTIPFALHPSDNDTKFNFSPSCLPNGWVEGSVTCRGSCAELPLVSYHKFIPQPKNETNRLAQHGEMPVCHDGKQPACCGGGFDRQVGAGTVIQHWAVKGISCSITKHQCTAVSHILSC